MDKWIEGVRDRLLDKLALNAYLLSAEPFKLSSGAMSSEYLDCRAALSYPDTLYMAANVVWAALSPSTKAVGGLTMGADPIAISVSMFSQSMGNLHIVRWFSVRKAPKDHGSRRSFEGRVWPGESVTVVDDVVSLGASVIKAVDICRRADLQVVQIVTLVDRGMGGLTAIEAATGVKPEAIFTKDAIAERHKRLAAGQWAAT